MINKAQAVNTYYGQELHYGPCIITIGPRGGERLTQERWRVSGKCKTWKTRPNEFRVPIKYGLYQSSYLDHINASDFHLSILCAPLHHCHEPSCKVTTPCASCYACNEKARKAVDNQMEAGNETDKQDA